MRVVFDAHVALDLVLAREAFGVAAAQLAKAVHQERLSGSLCATTATTIHHVAMKAIGREQARATVRNLLLLFSVAAVDDRVLCAASESRFSAFEDAVLHEAALASGADAIVTRNTRDFQHSKLRVLSPEALLSALDHR